MQFERRGSDSGEHMLNEEKPIEGLAGGNAPLSGPARQRNVVFFGEGRLRSGWRLFMYLGIVIALGGALTLLVIHIFGEPRGIPPVSGMILQEVIGFAVPFGAAFVMSLLER